MITTNHHWRAFAYRSDVPEKILADRFDWATEDDHQDGFFNYRGWWWWYHLDEFTAVPRHPGPTMPDPLAGWDGYHGDSYFSGVVIKISPDGERYRIGTYIC